MNSSLHRFGEVGDIIPITGEKKKLRAQKGFMFDK